MRNFALMAVAFVMTGIAAVALVDALAAPGPVISTVEDGTKVTYTFDGAPSAPLNMGDDQPDNLSIVSLTTNDDGWIQPDPAEGGIKAHHGPGCEAPGHDGSVTHDVTTYAGQVYQCANHVMTFLGFGGYEALYLTPRHTLDLTGRSGKVMFDLSTLHRNNRNWVELTLQPWGDALVAPVPHYIDQFGGMARDAYVISNEGGSHLGGGFELHVTDEWVETRYEPANETSMAQAAGSPSAQNRQTVEVVFTPAVDPNMVHVKVWMPVLNEVWQDLDVPFHGDGQYVVSFSEHVYNAKQSKGCVAGEPGLECSNGWHWDNLTIDPAVEFTMVHANERYAKNGDTITLEQSAPANAFLRFAAVGYDHRVSFDGGAYVDAVETPGSRGTDSTAFHSFRVNIPEGTNTVTFELNGSWKNHASGFDVWAQGTVVPTPTPTPTPEPVCELAVEEVVVTTLFDVQYQDGVEVSRTQTSETTVTTELSREVVPCE